MSGQETPPDRLPPDRIELRGLGVVGTHGALPEEHQRAQPFEVDLDLELDLRLAGRTDRLGDTVDYGSVTQAVAAVVAGPHVNLLETLAARIAAAALASGAPHATAVTVSVRKTRPPVPYQLTSAGVTIRRVGPGGPAAPDPAAPDPDPAAPTAADPGRDADRDADPPQRGDRGLEPRPPDQPEP